MAILTHCYCLYWLVQVVEFGNNKQRSKNAVKLVMKNTADAQFQLLHLSLLREYLWLEFTANMPAAVAGSMSLERVIDDFVFMTFLVGNDFLPHMPALDIGEC
jgi:5'-3' exonuclease